MAKNHSRVFLTVKIQIQGNEDVLYSSNIQDYGDVTMEAGDLMRESKTYAKVLQHRNNCKKWTKGFCLECFGGGLTKFTESLLSEGLIKP